ncbi:MAG: phosphoribosylformylglycinamidine synthase subunit PurQ [Thermoguttaceae bacterium]|nr:phosphoribosylformylglycinamidine synthase subunit PurQ [Thermoguttaceae bacterium]MBR3219709.1 phosphoribosylformylglycinamidine synthase subunit PurQ [Thermoguttaceae bacterium]
MKANKPNVLILRAPGTNCDFETAYAFELAGASAERVHVNRLLEDPSLLDRFEILCFPGGFSFGDDVAAGRILATELRHNLFEPLHRFKEAGRLILGICNGFQILVKSGLLLADDEAQPKATLTWNKSGVYTDRWAHLTVDGGKCVFLKGITSLYLPVAHAEGRFVGRDEAVLDQLQANGQLALRYAPDENPNGAERNVAGLCDETGRVFGLMPHPERYIDPTQHPYWTRLEHLPEVGDGLALFRNAVEYFG